MATRFMLDTNIASYIIRGAGPTLAARLLAVPMARVCVLAVTQGELLYGVARKPGATHLATAVRHFLMRVDVLAWGSQAAKHYGEMRAMLDAAGTPLGNNDAFIAAHALSEGAVLVTNDQAFERVPGLVVENWVSA